MQTVKILASGYITSNVKRLVLEKPANYQYTPGQATKVAINQPGWIDRKINLTFTSRPDEKILELTAKIYPLQQYPTHQGVTEKLSQLQVGDQLLIDQPWGTISYQGPGIFIAGGAGLTPFLAIFRQLFFQQKLVGNRLLYSNKYQQEIIVENELKAYFHQPESLVLQLTQEQKTGYGFGRIDQAFLEKTISDFHQPFYLCGPKAMVTDLTSILQNLGAQPETIVFEQ